MNDEISEQVDTMEKYMATWRIYSASEKNV